MQNHIYQQRSWGFGRTCSNLLEFITRKVRAAGDGLLAKCLVMPAGKDKTISPVILTMHLEHQAHERKEKRQGQCAGCWRWRNRRGWSDNVKHLELKTKQLQSCSQPPSHF